MLSGGNPELIDVLDAPNSHPPRMSGSHASFPDVHMDTVELIAEGDTVIGRFTCTATHTGTWQGHQPTGSRFTNIDEVNLYGFHNGQITGTWNLEDNLKRLTQLGPLPNT